jgi:hypothetical protein
MAKFVSTPMSNRTSSLILSVILVAQALMLLSGVRRKDFWIPAMGLGEGEGEGEVILKLENCN